jgi:peroxiredoxin Q/BCP
VCRPSIGRSVPWWLDSGRWWKKALPLPPSSSSQRPARLSACSPSAARPVVIFFYPKDDTPGCTKEACGFRDAYDVFQERGAVILDVSPDDEA